MVYEKGSVVMNAPSAICRSPARTCHMYELSLKVRRRLTAATTQGKNSAACQMVMLGRRLTLKPIVSDAREGIHDLNRRWSEQDDEQRREDAEHQWEDQFHRGGEGLLLCSLTPPDPHLVGLHTQHACDGHTERFRLQHGQQERPQLVEVGAVHEMTHRVPTAHTDSSLLEHAEEFLRERPRNRGDDSGERRIETESCLNRDHQEVEDVRKGPLHGETPLIDLPRQPRFWSEET